MSQLVPNVSSTYQRPVFSELEACWVKFTSSSVTAAFAVLRAETPFWNCDEGQFGAEKHNQEIRQSTHQDVHFTKCAILGFWKAKVAPGQRQSRKNSPEESLLPRRSVIIATR
jgi:hypothetical protein